MKMRELIEAFEVEEAKSEVNYNLNPAEQKKAFNLLAAALRYNKLPITNGRRDERKAEAGEFELMDMANSGPGTPWVYRFKHSYSRNYLFVKADTGGLVIPTTGQPFFQGEFPGANDPPPATTFADELIGDLKGVNDAMDNLNAMLKKAKKGDSVATEDLKKEIARINKSLALFSRKLNW